MAKKTSKSSKKKLIVPIPQNRRSVISLRLGDSERKLADRYFAKYKIVNKSRWLRELVMRSIYQQMMADYPMLFDEAEMRKR